MKRVVPWIAAIALLLMVSVPALANAKYMYATKDNVKVYESPSRHSDVVYYLDAGEEVACVDRSDDGNWYAFYAGGDLCWVQRKYLSSTEYCDHEWGRWKVLRKATCTQTGKRTRECELCGQTETEEIKKLPHEYSAWSMISQPTCTREGMQGRSCRVCGQAQMESIAKLPHTYGDWTVTLQPTCTATGMQMHKCKVCGYEETTSIAKVPHNYGEWQVSTEATDHTNGVRSHTCVDCGYREAMTFYPEGTLRRNDQGNEVRNVQTLLADQGYLNPAKVNGIFDTETERAIMQFQRVQGLYPDGVAWPQTQKRLVHDYGDWVITSPLTRYANGECVRICKECGYQQRKTQAAAPIFRRGDRGEGVRTLQEMLNALGYNAGSADGIYGGKLDTALQLFNQSRGNVYVPGTVRPIDIDNLFNSWIAVQQYQGTWNTQTSGGSPVMLTLTVNPAGKQADDPDDILRFTWSITNLGYQSCKLRAVMLGFGGDHSFTGNNIVLAIDGTELRASGANSLSGSFIISTAWNPQPAGDSDSLPIRFCALGTNGNDKWLSNVVSQEAGR